MADPRSAMKEFRVLDQKRAGEGLTAEEEARYAQLRDLVEPELGAGAGGGGFDVDAAAAELRDSLLPAGGGRGLGAAAEPPPGPAPTASGGASDLEAELFGPPGAGDESDALFEDAALDALDAGLGGAEPPLAEAPAEEGAWSGEEAPSPDGAPAAALSWDPDAPQLDASQPYDPNAPPYDASQPYDPNAPAYDASQPYDPNAPPYDASQPYDPNAPPYDASQPYDPNAPAYDASQPYDPNAPAYDASQPYDPAQAWDPNAAVPDAPPWDAGAEPSEAPSSAAEAEGAQDLAEPLGLEPIEADEADEATAEWAGPEPFESSLSDAAPAEPAGGGAAWDPGALVDAATLDPGAEPWPASPEAAAPAEAWETTGALAMEEAGDALASGEPPFGELDPAGDSPDAGAPPFLADASPLPPAGWAPEPEPSATAPVDPSALGEYDEIGSGPTVGDDAGLASLDPFDGAAAAQAEGAAQERPLELGEYDDTAGFGRSIPDVAPPDLGEDASGFHAAQELGDLAEDALAPEGALEDAFELASGGSFDAAAAAAAPEWAGEATTPPWEEPLGAAPGAEAPLEEADAGAVSPELDGLVPPDAPAELEALPPDALPVEGGEPTDLLPLPEVTAELFGPEPGREAGGEPQAPDLALAEAGVSASPDLGAPALAEAPAAVAPPPATAPDGEDFAIDVDVDDIAALAAEPAPAPEAEAEIAGAEPGGEEAELAPQLPAFVRGDLSPEPADDAPVLPGAEPALDFSKPDFSEGAPDDDDPYLGPPRPASPPPAARAATAAPPAPAAPPAVAAPPAARALPHLELEDASDVPEGIPTIDGEEILEEVPEGAAPPQSLDFAPPPQPLDVAPQEAPPPATAPAPPSLPAAAPSQPAPDAGAPAARALELPCRVPGVHRVVVHTVEGQVRRGILDGPDLAAAALALQPLPGAPAEDVATERVKAIFFMLAPGEAPPAAEGKRVRVTFKDGRQVAGFSPDYDDSGPGFFMVPGDTRTNTGRIWVYRAAARAISVS